MEFILVVGILIAIVGALTIVAVMWQGNAKPTAQPSADEPAIPAAENAAELPQTDEAADAESIASAVDVALSDKTSTTTIDADNAPLTIESITALYAHANDDVAVTESSLQINVANVLATQIERLYEEYVRLDEERTRLAEALLTHMLFEKIERSAGRLEIATERETLDLREQFGRVSADYNRVQFRLGSLQHLNVRMHDPRVAQQLDELVLEVKRLASQT